MAGLCAGRNLAGPREGTSTPASTHEDSAMTSDFFPCIESQLTEMRSMLIEMKTAIQSLQAGPAAARSAYTVKEAAKILDVSEYTVRQWCNEVRINASKRSERRGKAE